jgi:hypothetical protein
MGLSFNIQGLLSAGVNRDVPRTAGVINSGCGIAASRGRRARPFAAASTSECDRSDSLPQYSSWRRIHKSVEPSSLRPLGTRSSSA